jgi:hypothetical protein
LKRRRLLDVLLAIIAVVSVAVVLLLHEDPFARIAVCNHISFCPTFAPLSFQVFHSPIDGGDQFIIPLAFGPSLFRSQHVGELGQHVAFFLPNEHGIIFCLSL